MEIKVLVVDDHAMMREGLVMLLNNKEGFCTAGSVGSGEEAINVVDSMNPDVIIMDIVLPGMTGIEASKWIIDRNPKAKILLLSMFADLDLIEKGISVGVLGYILKEAHHEELIEAIRLVSIGERSFSTDITNLIFEKFHSKSLKSNKDISRKEKSPLSIRELEITKLVTEGLSNREIGEILFISKKTVDAHVYNIEGKLHLKNKVDLVNYVHKNKLFDND